MIKKATKKGHHTTPRYCQGHASPRCLELEGVFSVGLVGTFQELIPAG